MKLNDFDFELPNNLIAQTPLPNRDGSRLLVLNVDNGTIKHDNFTNIIDYFESGDILVRNNTKVLPARLIGSKELTKGAVELLLLKQVDEEWECLVGGAKKINIGTIIIFGDGKLKAKCTRLGEGGIRYFIMIHEGLFYNVLSELGHVPLPPYIRANLEDKQRYQTVYATELGSSAAPTAGLHFTENIFETLTAKGVIIVDITLHVGLGTFKGVTESEIENHHMHEEFYQLNDSSAALLNSAKDSGRRIIAVGTTTVRVLETIYRRHGQFKGESGNTNIFIYPPQKVNSIDGLITNFHLPKSTLLMLVSALASTELIKRAYQEAIVHEYRFFSFGDAMLILP